MPRRILPIALTVEHHDEGHYYWVLLEALEAPGLYETLMESASGFSTYGEALAAGCAALKGLCHNPERGPQEKRRRRRARS